MTKEKRDLQEKGMRDGREKEEGGQPIVAKTGCNYRQAGQLDKDSALAYFALGRALAISDPALSRRCYRRYVQLAREETSENVKVRLAEASAACE